MMAATTRNLRRYDHRLRELVQSTGDVQHAIHRGVPRSTAREKGLALTKFPSLLSHLGKSLLRKIDWIYSPGVLESHDCAGRGASKSHLDILL
jgi:hypothetical protein